MHLAVLRGALVAALCLISGSAFAIYRCDIAGAVSYSDAPCPGGRELDIQQPSDRPAAAKRLAEDKKTVRRAEAEHSKAEAAEAKARQRAAKRRLAMDRKCDALERKQRWAKEDQKAASAKAMDKARQKANRAAERYEAECGNGQRLPPMLQS